MIIVSRKCLFIAKINYINITHEFFLNIILRYTTFQRGCYNGYIMRVLWS